MSNSTLSPRTKCLFIIFIILCGMFAYNFRDIYNNYQEIYSDYQTLQNGFPIKEVTEKNFGEDVFAMEITENIATLANSTDSFVRQNCAKSSYADVNILLQLAQDQDVYVRRNVAINHNVTAEILQLLAQDNDNYVKRLVVNHPNTTPQSIYKIAESSSSTVRWHIARSNKFDNTIWDIWKLQELTSLVLVEIANNENTPPAILEELLSHKDLQIRRSIAQNKATAINTLEKLLEDEDQKTILFAQQNLNAKN